MMRVLPLRFRRLADNRILFAHEAGGYFLSGQGFLERLATNRLEPDDITFLSSRGYLLEEEGLADISFLNQLARRLAPAAKLDYVLLVPTLRCDLACSYCQVSRASLSASGYDWSEETLEKTLGFLDREGGDTIQVEFQGGEPTLRLDLLEKVTSFCRQRFSAVKFILCTNLSSLEEPLKSFLASPDVFVSTSLDGPADLHQAQRTGSAEATQHFRDNLAEAMDIAPGRVAALPTLDPAHLPSPSELLDAYEAFGLRSVYLRQIVYQGFARKRHPGSRQYETVWADFYEAVIAEILRRNAQGAQPPYDEYYLVLAMKRLLQPGTDGHIDLRSPNWLGYDHMVVDFDGRLYPTDEARMLARTGQIDLSIGSVETGIDVERRRSMQGRAFNALDPWCSQCVYQAACGSDPIDDIARSGRADSPKPDTAFCQRHLHIFDTAVSMLASGDETVQASIAGWLDLPGKVQLVDIHDCP